MQYKWMQWNSGIWWIGHCLWCKKVGIWWWEHCLWCKKVKPVGAVDVVDTVE